jgi:hypothetical protein
MHLAFSLVLHVFGRNIEYFGVKYILLKLFLSGLNMEYVSV